MLPPGGGNVDTNPFTVTWRVNPADPTGTTFQAKVNLNSNLLLSSNLYDNTPITGLDTWTACTANDTWWLLATTSGNVVTPGTPTIHNFGNGNTDYNPTASPWTTGGIAESDNASPVSSQILFRKVIATSVADANGRPNIKQYVQTDLVMKNIALNGQACIYPFPL